MTAFVITCAALVGACVGSFLNVCIYRLPEEDLSIGQPRTSFCPKCKTPIRWFDNVPVLGWLLLRARCRSCKAPISARYPMVELLTAATFVLVVLEIGEIPEPTTSSSAMVLEWLFVHLFWAIVVSALIVITFIDIDHRIIPDEVSVTGAALVPFAAWTISGVPVDPFPPEWGVEGLRWLRLTEPLPAAAEIPVLALAGGLGAVISMVAFRRFSPAWDGGQRTWWETRLAAVVGGLAATVLAGATGVGDWLDRPTTLRLVASLFGMLVGGGCIYSIGVLGKVIFRKPAMGFGDVKLMALLGAVLGWKLVLLAVFIACLLGSVVGIAVKVITRSSYIPFGPFLSAGALVLVFWGDWVALGLDWYRSLFPR
ncbi:MAG: prepilin peptidase [Planctomycetota bacterium]